LLRRLFALIVLVGFAVAGFYYWKSRPDAPREIKDIHVPQLDKVEDAIRDKAIATAVRTAFALNRTLQPLGIEVSAEDGVVTLRGEAPSDEAKATAERVASDVPEVKQVVSHVNVKAGAGASPGPDRTIGETVDDKKLEVQVHLALSLNRKLEGQNFDVKAFKREVTISGEVASAAQKALAVSVAKDTPGVSSVTDAIRIRGKDGGKS
jgi:osmotically-inducible protein OsmY